MATGYNANRGDALIDTTSALYRSKKRAYALWYRMTHPDKVKACKKKCYAKDPEKTKKQQQEKYARNKDNIVKGNKIWRDKNREKVRGYQKAWRQRNPIKIRTFCLNYRARKKQLSVLDCFEKIKVLCHERFCHWCCRALTSKNRAIDHVLSLKRGGFHTPDNLVASCRQCNCRKSSKLVSEWEWEAV